MKKYYKIADSFLAIDCEERYISDEFSEFEVGENEICEDNTLYVTGKTDLKPEIIGERIIKNETVTIYDNNDSFLIIPNTITSVYGIKIFKDTNRTNIYYTDKKESDKVEEMYALKEPYFFFLQKKGKLVVHSASIIYSGKAWLFSAVSGTGKSTHVNMWRKAGIDFEDFNGDTAVCYVDDKGNAVAARMPWSGSSGLYCNKVVPLGGVLYLKRSEENNIVCISKKEGIINLIARSFSPNWNKNLMQKTVNVAKELGNKIAFGEICCLPNAEAAIITKEYIDDIN